MGFFDKLKKGLNKTRENLTQKIEKLVIGYADIDDDFLDELEETLIMADVGVQTTEKLMAAVRKGIKKKEINSPQDLKPFLAKEITAILTAGEENDKTRVAADGPTVMLVIGVNGAGKTTTIGKLSAYYKEQGKSVMLAAADTFRAAAIDQLEVWGQRTGAKVIKHEEGSDPAAVAFDAVKAAKARGVDILIVDTAGRLQTKSNLMHDLYEKPKVTIDIPVSNGYYCNLRIGREVTDEDVLRIRRHMQEIIDAHIPIHRHECLTEDAIRCFNEIGANSKVKLLKSNGKLYSVYYDIDGYIDYYYGTMLTNTGDLYLFGLEKYYDGLLLRIPSKSSPT